MLVGFATNSCVDTSNTQFVADALSLGRDQQYWKDFRKEKSARNKIEGKTEDKRNYQHR